MKKVKFLSILAASSLFLGSCSDDQNGASVVENPVKGGEEIIFGSSLTKSQIETRTIYGDEETEGGDYNHGYFPVYWEDGDNITILCPQASNGTRVDYTITPLEGDKTTSADVTKVDPSKAGLQWNGNVDEHEFFAFYPAEAIRGEAVPDDGIVTVNIPVEQDPVRWEKRGDNTWVGIANTDYAYMWAYNKVKKSETPQGTSIPLPFKPMTTVLEITVNGPKSGSQAVSQVTVTSVAPASAENPNTILSGEIKCNIRAAAENNGTAICETAGNLNEVRNRISVNLYNAKGDGRYPTLSAGEKLKVYVSIMPKDESIEKGNLKVTVAGVNTPAKEKTLQTATIIAHAINKVSLPALDATGSQTDINYWMSNLDPDIYLTELSWPGSKMSAITYEKGVDDVWLIGDVHNGYTQRNTLTEQFELGVRAFDFPTVYSGNSIELGRETYTSGTASIGTSLKEALDELAACLQKADDAKKNQEAVFVNISYAASRFILSRDHEDQWLSTLMSTFNDWKNDRICTSEVKANTTLGDVAGKIILRIHVKGENVYPNFTKYLPAQLVCYSEPFIDTSKGQTAVPMSWGTAASTNGLQLYYEDQTRLANGGFLDITKNDGTPDDKKKNVAAVVQESVNQYVKNKEHNIWYLIDLGGFYTTAIFNISIYNGEAAAEELTPHFFEFFNTRTENASLGVVYMNFADNLADYGARYGCDQLIQTIINNNFTFQLRTRGSDSKASAQTRGVSVGNDDPNSWD